MHCLREPQVHFSQKITSKLGPMALFTHLKIILLQYFQFLVISGVRSQIVAHTQMKTGDGPNKPNTMNL